MRQYLRVRFRWDDDEGEDWVEGDGLLDPLLQARSELAAGDLRLLYLERLLKIQLSGLDDEDADFEDGHGAWRMKWSRRSQRACGS